MFNKIFGKKESFLSPVSGELIAIEQVNDAVFSQKMMGDGFAIIPEGKDIYAPISGVICANFPTKHAIGIKDEHGKEVLIHIGINTVELKGEGFTSYVEQGQKVKQGEKLVSVDPKELIKLGYDPVVIVIFPNASVVVKERMRKIDLQQPIEVKF